MTPRNYKTSSCVRHLYCRTCVKKRPACDACLLSPLMRCPCGPLRLETHKGGRRRQRGQSLFFLGGVSRHQAPALSHISCGDAVAVVVKPGFVVVDDCLFCAATNIWYADRISTRSHGAAVVDTPPCNPTSLGAVTRILGHIRIRNHILATRASFGKAIFQIRLAMNICATCTKTHHALRTCNATTAELEE